MSYPGGIAAKHGERYETRWTVNCVLDMLRGNVESIDLEPIDWEGSGVEFVLVRDGQSEYHQVKRRGSGRWSLTALKAEGVLAAFSASTGRMRYPRISSSWLLISRPTIPTRTKTCGRSTRAAASPTTAEISTEPA